MKTLGEITLSAILASLYAVAVIILAVISFGIIQLRIADCLITLSALFGWPAITGVTIGCFIGNAYYPVGWCDYCFGPLANLIAGYVIFRLRRRPIIGSLLGALIIGLIVGGYLWLFLPVPEIGLYLHPCLVSIISITASSIITMVLIGCTLLKALSRPAIVRMLLSRGIPVHIEA
jgi:uncharacterized membrane protein